MKLEVSNALLFSELKTILKEKDVILRIKGNSMWPFFKSGKTSVYLHKVELIKKYEIYLFQLNDTYVLHRLIKIKNDKLIFKGDGNHSIELITKDDLIGHVVSYQNKKKIDTKSKFYKFRVRLYLLFPRRITIKLFKR
ncbi:MAG: S24/S26 family peptidase [Acholeplasmataceae bacterium]|nr:S24/S26 family peptidase [Acholeplasmataceae bacterium]